MGAQPSRAGAMSWCVARSSRWHRSVPGTISSSSRWLRALDDAIKRAGLPCTVFTDGMTVVIDNETSREPDAAVQCGVAVDLDSMVLQAPLIVVEITSPSSERDDTGDKLVEYFSVPSIRHYLIVNPAKNVVVHHARDATELSQRAS